MIMFELLMMIMLGNKKELFKKKGNIKGKNKERYKLRKRMKWLDWLDVHASVMWMLCIKY